MDLLEALQRFYFETTLDELRQLRAGQVYPNLSYNSLLYLDLIYYYDGKNCTVSSLAERLQVSKAAVTIKVNELLRQGLVEKTQSPDDKRVHFLSVKKEIREEFGLFDRQLSRAVKQLESEYSKEEVQFLCNAVHSLQKHMTNI